MIAKIYDIAISAVTILIMCLILTMCVMTVAGPTRDTAEAIKLETAQRNTQTMIAESVVKERRK